MTSLKTMALLGTAAFALSACLGGGSADNEEFQDEFDLFSALSAGELASIDTGARTGTATMTGAVAVNVETDDGEEVEVLSPLTLEADFDADTATGSANDFNAYDVDGNIVEGGDLDGSMAVTNGAISGDEFTADLDGTLTNDDNSSFVFDLEMDGGFYDNNGTTVVGGDVNGTLFDVDFGTTDTIEGGFVASE